MRPSTTARRYAEAAFAVARRDGDLVGWLQDLQAADEALQDPEVGNFFRDPDVSREDKLATLGKLIREVRPHVLNLLRLLAVRQRLYLLPNVVAEFARLEHEARGIDEAHVTVARAVSAAERQDIVRRLEQLTGKKVEIHVQVDPAILGGIVVRIGDRLIDGSVAGRLVRLRQEMAV